MAEVEEKEQKVEEAPAAEVTETKTEEKPGEKVPFELSDEEIDEIISTGVAQETEEEKPESTSETEETTPVEEPVKVESKPPAPIQPPVTAEEKQVEDKLGKPPELPDEILQVDYTKFMPQGEEFDPHEALIAGTASSRARVRGDAELAGRVQDYRQQQRDRKVMREVAEREFTGFVSRTPEMQNPEAQREYLDFAMTSTLEGAVMTHEELLETMKFIKYRRKQKLTSKGPKKPSTTVPLTAASSSAEPELKSGEDLEAVVRSKIGEEAGI